MIEALIIVGIVLIVLAFLFLLPFVGVGTIIPVAGEIIDLPLSVIFFLTGGILLVLGGIANFIVNFFWYGLAIIIIYLLFMYFSKKINKR